MLKEPIEDSEKHFSVNIYIFLFPEQELVKIKRDHDE